MIHVSRSAIVTRKQCEMKRFRQYHYRMQSDQKTPGIIPIVNVNTMGDLARERGKLFHSGAETLMRKHETVQETLDRLTQHWPVELRAGQLTLIRRALLGWQLIRHELLDHYSLMSMEREWSWEMLPGRIAQHLRLDQVLRHNELGSLAILDFKTMTSLEWNWAKRMRISDQTHLYVQALSEVSSEWIDGMIYEGIVIGKYDKEKRTQVSPFVGGYKKNGIILPKWKAGSEFTSLVDAPDEEWLEWIQEGDFLRSLYTTTGAILPPPDQLLHTKDATITGEEAFADKLYAVEAADDYEGEALKMFERNSEACFKYGMDYACPYVGICWDGEHPDPGVFTEREDHHASHEETR